ncbi:transcription-repair coupling factor [Haloferula sp.]|uniref:transcription-repair coupling factor n=1 Tax=Haloferula sp. TaxID=2497595 RepID=UPI00329D14DF
MPKPAHDPNLWLTRASRQPDFAQRLEQVSAGDGTTVFDHVSEAATAWMIAVVRRSLTSRKRIWITAPSPKLRERLATELELWKIDALILSEPPLETEGELTDAEGAAARIDTLDYASDAKSFVILTHPGIFTDPAPSPATLSSGRIVLRTGKAYDPEKLAAQLAEHGYDRSHLVQARGQFAVRGGILDVFPWQGAVPFRIEFFDTDVESIREFDVDSQASVRKVTKADLLLGDPENDATVDAYRQSGDLIISVGESDELSPHIRITDTPADTSTEEDFSTACFANPLGRFEAGDFVLEQSRRDHFFSQLAEWNHDEWQVGIVFANKGEEERFTELAGEISRFVSLRGELMESFTVPSAKLALISSSEIFGRYRNPAATRRSRLDRQRVASARASLDDISEGDMVVHSEYGIGRFVGIEQSDDDEHISIEYRDGGLLSVPIDQAHLIGKYVGLGGKAPILSKLGGTAWKNVRKTAEKTILDYAAVMLRIQAERQAVPGFAHPPDSRWMWEFENSFHFTETPDQQRAIEEAKRDMESPRPMDRLVCGDVGFGKTEVAIRAAFKAVTGGKQVALLCPTTVLAEQHWRTFRERMSDYPIRIDLLNRFRTPAEIRATINGVADGSVDIVIGTHRLLSGDVQYHDLGLAVVDEEQRFGVKHKEKFKELFRQIDVITLSATPIPRTLYMALMGARDMSTIDTPPPNRVPVHTSVTPYDERIIRDAIEHEMKRDGQIFFLHNRVKSIEMMRKKLTELVPDARILVGHGQMHKDELEVVMRKFVNGEADILLATTIIETGIDIPNANTILIDRADRFGLADLYQLRGRVGRAGEKAYAILLLPRDFVTAGDARKRIHAIKQYTALGSGFKIAMRDLEIRGAGNLLGTKQSGQIAAVGFDLYCQLLRQSVDRLQGKTPKQRVETTFRSDFVAFSENEFTRGSADVEMLAAYMPSTWLSETRLRISAYRELAETLTVDDLDKLAASWADRFGKLPEPAANLVDVTRLRLIAGAQGVSSIEIKGQRLMLQRNGDYIMLEGRRFPRLTTTAPDEKLAESIAMLQSL